MRSLATIILAILATTLMISTCFACIPSGCVPPCFKGPLAEETLIHGGSNALILEDDTYVANWGYGGAEVSLSRDAAFQGSTSKFQLINSDAAKRGLTGMKYLKLTPRCTEPVQWKIRELQWETADEIKLRVVSHQP